MSSIVLCTLNARYIHTAFGLRYLKANMGALLDDTEIIEFTIHERPIDIAERLLANNPKIIGLGVYIWNIEQSTQLAALIKTISPETTLVLGGPEVSYEHAKQNIIQFADYVICGQADLEFSKLCRLILDGEKPDGKIITPLPIKLEQLKFPYQLYTDDDIANRIIYVEASRGCPFRCEFCLSALDKTANPFDLDAFLNEIALLYQRGVRHFKFVDRTFNLKIDNSIRILNFFLERLDEDLFLHFEIIPDHLPEKLKTIIKCFPPGSLQFEIGIQTFNQVTQTLISRKQNNIKSEENLQWIRKETNAHIHADLIIGLPGEDIASFEEGFNALTRLAPHEIQVGILKRLNGSPIARHSDAFNMRYNPSPPYNILSNNLIDFGMMQRLNRFARYWDMIANSGRFQHSLILILEGNPFKNFLALSDHLFEITGQTHKIALKRLYLLVYQALCALFQHDDEIVKQALTNDFINSGLKGHLNFGEIASAVSTENHPALSSSRQNRHLNSP